MRYLYDIHILQVHKLITVVYLCTVIFVWVLSAMALKDEAKGASCTSSGIKDDLFQFPCLFNHSFLDTLSHPRLESVLHENDSYAEYEEKEQQRQLDNDDPPKALHVVNLSVLFLWLLGRQNEAEERAQRQLQDKPNDVISLSSITFIWLSKGDHAGAQELLGRLVALREGDPHLYSERLQAAKETLISLYKRCIDVVEPFVLSELLEEMLREDPSNSVVKYNLARMLKCFSQPLYITKHPGVDFTGTIRRSMELFFELKNAETEAVPDETRAMAAADLGDIVAWRPDQSQRDVVDQEMKRLGIKDAIECFEEALRLCPNKPGVLIRIGKAIRFYDLDKSKELLEKAVTLVPDSPRAHHYLAITLRSVVVESRKKKKYGQRAQGSGNFRDSQPNWNRKEKSRKDMLNQKKWFWLRRDEEHVNEMIEHLKMAVECHTTSPDFSLRITLALSYVSLGEYKEAFELLSIIVDTFSKPGVLGRVLDDAYVIYAKEAEKARDAASWRVRRNPGESTLTLSSRWHCLRNVTVIVECQLLQEQKANSSSSQDNGDLYNLTTLFEMVHNKEFSTTPRGRALSSIESHFVECLIDCAQQEPLKAMSGARRGLDSDMDWLEKASRNSYRNGCFDDAAMLLILRRWLMEMNGKPQVGQGTGAESASPDSPDVLLVKSCVQAASPRLQEHDFDYLFQRSLAKFFFKLAFERALAARQMDQAPEHSSSGYQVLILTERNARNEDEGPEKDVQYILGDVCGLTVTTIDLTEESAGHHHLTQAVDKAQVVLIVVGDADMSPAFSAAVSVALPAPGASSGDRFVTMLLDGTSLPSCLQGQRWFPWQQERLALAKDSSGSKDAASAACQLFANVLGVDVEL